MITATLDRRITIESPAEINNAIGEPVATWAPFAVVWAALRPVRGRERIAADQVAAEVDVLITIRWLAGVTEKMRVNHDGRLYDIQHVAEVGRRDGLELAASLRRA